MNVDDEISVEDKAGPLITDSILSQGGATNWPSSSSLTARLRRLITAFQRSYRQEQLKIEAEAKGDRRRRRCEQASKLKEIARQERQQRYGIISASKVLNVGHRGSVRVGVCLYSRPQKLLLQSHCQIGTSSPHLSAATLLGGHAGRSVTSTAWYRPSV